MLARGFPLEKGVKVKRCWMDEVADLQCDREEANRGTVVSFQTAIWICSVEIAAV